MVRLPSRTDQIGVERVVRVLLLHNPTAGHQRPTPAELVRIFERAGHDVLYRSTKDPRWSEALEASVEVTVAAGGDGTVSRSAQALVARPERGRPALAVVPLGTANNIARTVGAWENADRVAGGLEEARRDWLAIGMVRAPWGETRFVESAGVGVFAALLRKSGPGPDPAVRFRDPDAGPANDKLQKGMRRLRRALADGEPWRLEIEADGRDLTGDYLLAEAMNIRSIGPRIALAPDANGGDEYLDLVLVGPAHRPMLQAWLDRSREREAEPPPALVCRARRLRLRWLGGHGHADDELWPVGDFAMSRTAEVTLAVEARVAVLVPGKGRTEAVIGADGGGYP